LDLSGYGQRRRLYSACIFRKRRAGADVETMRHGFATGAKPSGSPEAIDQAFAFGLS
jgi:hypothetical protein